MLVRRVAWAPTHVLTDSAFAATGFQYIARGGSPLRLAHSDPWQDIAAALATREDGFFVVTWKPAHTSEDDVDRGRVGPVERFMNQGADHLACDGADARPAPEQVTRQVLKQLAAARAFQAMSVEFLMERASATPLPGRQAGFSRGEKARWTGLGGNEDLDEGLQPSTQELDRIADEGIMSDDEFDLDPLGHLRGTASD